MAIQGLHHITLVCSNAQRTIDFYTGVLGLRLVKPAGRARPSPTSSGPTRPRAGRASAAPIITPCG
jgi:catechol 2,3-dioxygenase-like lactoylglutathione lyase family enzyme